MTYTYTFIVFSNKYALSINSFDFHDFCTFIAKLVAKMFSLLNKVNMKAGLLLECMIKNNKQQNQTPLDMIKEW